MKFYLPKQFMSIELKIFNIVLDIPYVLKSNLQSFYGVIDKSF